MVKIFLVSALGGLIGIMGGLALKLLLPSGLFLGVGIICSVVLFTDIVMSVGNIIRDRRRRKESVNRESQGK